MFTHKLESGRGLSFKLLHQGVWTSAHRQSDGPRPTPWVLPAAGCTDVRRPVRATLRTMSYSARHVSGRTTCYTLRYRRYLPRHNDTTSGNDHTVSNCLNIRLSYLILTSWYACCTRTLINSRYTHVFSLLLACVMPSLLINEYCIVLYCNGHWPAYNWPSRLLLRTRLDQLSRRPASSRLLRLRSSCEKRRWWPDGRQIDNSKL